MAHYAFLDKNNVVTEVITGVDETELIEGLHPEHWYAAFRGQPCKRTSYNTIGNQHRLGGTPFRKNYAAEGYSYIPEFDAFVPPQPYPSWELNYTSFLWEAPIAKPENIEGYRWVWSEPNKKWISIVR
jgi:hypothetical protein